MSQEGESLFSVGEQIALGGGRIARVVRFIGEGGQGTVFEVDIGGEPMALKWYFSHTGTEQQRVAIGNLVKRGAPNGRYLWPVEVVEHNDRPAFGYLMPLRPRNHVTLASLLRGRVDARAAVRTTLCRDLAQSFLNLHSQGLCYRDISFANIFLDPRTGRVLICDNDNVAIDDGAPSPVLGTRKFMAPEIVRREAEPSTFTDLWSLAVLLFYVLVVGHPLLGRRELQFPTWDDVAEVEMFGRNPVFVFHPGDHSNRPDPAAHGAMEANWASLTTSVRELFVKSFTVGVEDTRMRVRESVWQRAMTRLEDSIADCRRCGAENFYDPVAVDVSCWACGRPLGVPMRLEFEDGRWVVLSRHAKIWRHHVTRMPTYDFERAVAEVSEHPDRPGVWGLHNIGDTPWQVLPPGGEVVEVQPNRSYGLVAGTVFRFGDMAATLVV